MRTWGAWVWAPESPGSLSYGPNPACLQSQLFFVNKA